MPTGTPNGISELAKKLGVSRQYVWQLRKSAEGKCRICGEPKVSANYCLEHQLAQKKINRKAKGFKPWRKGKPGRPPTFTA